jgi:malonate decarboxylase delta subunit
MEALQFQYSGGHLLGGRATLVGVVSSGNLEVLVEPQPLHAEICEVHIITTVAGYRAVWSAVVSDFFHRHRVGGVCISVNDAGATPATVGLRLDQAIEAYKESQ